MDWRQAIVTIVCTVLTSSGMWAFLEKIRSKKDYTKQMLVGLAHDRILDLGMYYLDRGWITIDEFENLYEYLYIPYHKLGGNGTAEKVVNSVKKLTMYTSVSAYYEQKRKEDNNADV